jgi:hypothetical protein
MCAARAYIREKNYTIYLFQCEISYDFELVSTARRTTQLKVTVRVSPMWYIAHCWHLLYSRPCAARCREHVFIKVGDPELRRPAKIQYGQL